MLIPELQRDKSVAEQISCVNNLKNIGLAVRIFSSTVPQSILGPLPVVTADQRSMSPIPPLSGASSPPSRTSSTAPSALTAPLTANGRFVSCALGLSAPEEAPQSVLGADCNLRLDDAALTSAMLSFPSDALVTFDQRLHNEAGDLFFGDGSVQQAPSHDLSDVFRDAHQATGTNVLAFP
jgi:hypothetical protein